MSLHKIKKSVDDNKPNSFWAKFSLPLSLDMCFSLFVIAGCCLIVALAVAIVCLSVSKP